MSDALLLLPDFLLILCGFFICRFTSLDRPVWEAAELASHYGIDNVCAIIDVNRLGQSGPTMLQHRMDVYRARWEAFGWRAIVVDGHDIAAVLTFAAAGASDGLDGFIARRWGLIVLVCAYGIETFGTITSFPFGDYHYTDRFGPMLGVVPLTIPLAWHVVVTNALFIVRAVTPYASRLAEAALAGLLCTLYDFVLEPFATTVKLTGTPGTTVRPTGCCVISGRSPI